MQVENRHNPSFFYVRITDIKRKGDLMEYNFETVPSKDGVSPVEWCIKAEEWLDGFKEQEHGHVHRAEIQLGQCEGITEKGVQYWRGYIQAKKEILGKTP